MSYLLKIIKYGDKLNNILFELRTWYILYLLENSLKFGDEFVEIDCSVGELTDKENLWNCKIFEYTAIYTPSM